MRQDSSLRLNNSNNKTNH